MKIANISDIILALTFIAIVWYAWETRGLKIQMIKQTELNLRPLVLIDWINPEKYVLRNIGNGPAINIQVEEIMIVEVPELKYLFRRIDVIETREQRDLEILFGGREADTFELGAITPHSAVKSFTYSIKYTDLNGTKYESIGLIGKGGAVFLETRRLN
jgi:hypothetical protein